MEPFYVSREDIASASDIKASAYMQRDIDRACNAGSRDVEKLCNRVFYPRVDTRTKDYPNMQSAQSGRLWLDADELISLTSLTSGGTSIPNANALLRPDSGPPFTYIELDRSTVSSLAVGSTSQRSIVISGLFGYNNDEESIGTLVGALNTSATTLQLTTSPGVGSLIRVNNERMIVKDKAWITSALTLQAPGLTASNANVSVAVTTGSAFSAGDVLLIDTERMLVQDVVSNSLIVKRAWSGTPLAAHTAGATIFYQRLLTVERATCGTTAGSHVNGDAARQYIPPTAIAQLAEAYALDNLFQRGSGYARTIGQGEGERAASGSAIRALEEKVRQSYGRLLRRRAV